MAEAIDFERETNNEFLTHDIGSAPSVVVVPSSTTSTSGSTTSTSLS